MGNYVRPCNSENHLDLSDWNLDFDMEKSIGENMIATAGLVVKELFDDMAAEISTDGDNIGKIQIENAEAQPIQTAI